MVRIWRMGKGSQTMEFSMKDHKGPVNCIVIKASTNDECVSASSDGSCIIWDMAHGRRRLSMFANTFFMSVAYHPDESQLVTTGTDRKVSGRRGGAWRGGGGGGGAGGVCGWRGGPVRGLWELRRIDSVHPVAYCTVRKPATGAWCMDNYSLPLSPA
jgi:hypothetical protein